MNNDKIFYTYIYLDPRKPGQYTYHKKLQFDFEPFYVGKGTGKQYLRHLRDGIKQKPLNKCPNPFKAAKIRHILEENLTPIIIKYHENIKEKFAFKIERCLIKYIGKHNDGRGPLTNVADGGEGASGFVHSLEARKKISEAAKSMWKNSTYIKGTRKLSIEARQKISEAQRGSKNYFYGKPNRNRGKKLSDAIRQHMSIAQRKSTYKNRAAHLKFINIGRKHSAQSRLNMSKAHSGKGNGAAKIYKAYDPLGNEYLLEGTARSFCKQHNFSYTALLVTVKTKKPIKYGNGKGWYAIFICSAH